MKQSCELCEVMVVARLPAGAGLHMKSHCREYCPSVGLSQVTWTVKGEQKSLQTRQAHYPHSTTSAAMGIECKHTCSVVPLVHSQAVMIWYLYKCIILKGCTST